MKSSEQKAFSSTKSFGLIMGRLRSRLHLIASTIRSCLMQKVRTIHLMQMMFVNHTAPIRLRPLNHHVKRALAKSRISSAARCRKIGGISRLWLVCIMNVQVILHKNQKYCWKGLFAPPPTRGTLWQIFSSGQGQRLLWRLKMGGRLLPVANLSDVLIRLETTLDVDFWEVDPDWDGKMFKSAAQSQRHARSGEIHFESKIKIGRAACIRFVTVDGKQFQLYVQAVADAANGL